MLTADTSGITDSDGLTNVVYQYQWLADDGSSVTEISGATGATYTLQATDEAATIKVQVSFSDDLDNEESLISAAVGPVAAAPPVNSRATGALTISGTAQVGQMLTADTSNIGDSDGLTNVVYQYQWLADDGSSVTEISGATGSTYTLQATDEGATIKVQVSFSDDADNEESLTSTATAVVAGPEPPAMPTGLSPSVSHDTVTLTWDDPQDDTITGYVILRRDREIHPVGTFVTLADDTGSADTTYTDDTVEPDKQYVYRIKAINKHGEVSEMSDWVRADTPAVPVPDKPTGLSAAVSHDAVTLAWDDPQDDSITGYVILRRDRAIHPVGTFVTIAGDTGSADTTYTDDTVEPDKEYVYRIKAINEHGEVSEKSRLDPGLHPGSAGPGGLAGEVTEGRDRLERLAAFRATKRASTDAWTGEAGVSNPESERSRPEADRRRQHEPRRDADGGCLRHCRRGRPEQRGLPVPVARRRCRDRRGHGRELQPDRGRARQRRQCACVVYGRRGLRGDPDQRGHGSGRRRADGQSAGPAAQPERRRQCGRHGDVELAGPGRWHGDGLPDLAQAAAAGRARVQRAGRGHGQRGDRVHRHRGQPGPAAHLPGDGAQPVRRESTLELRPADAGAVARADAEPGRRLVQRPPTRRSAAVRSDGSTTAQGVR